MEQLGKILKVRAGRRRAGRVGVREGGREGGKSGAWSGGGEDIKRKRWLWHSSKAQTNTSVLLMTGPLSRQGCHRAFGQRHRVSFLPPSLPPPAPSSPLIPCLNVPPPPPPSPPHQHLQTRRRACSRHVAGPNRLLLGCHGVRHVESDCRRGEGCAPDWRIPARACLHHQV